MAFHLRAASVDDIAVLLRLNAHVQTLHARIEPSFFKAITDPEELATYFAIVLENPDNQVILAEDDTALGYIWFQVQLVPETPFTWPRQRTYIYQIAVDEAARRRGVGSALLAHVEERSQDAGINTLALDTWASNSSAQAFFRARGYSTLTIGCEKHIGKPD